MMVKLIFRKQKNEHFMVIIEISCVGELTPTANIYVDMLKDCLIEINIGLMYSHSFKV